MNLTCMYCLNSKICVSTVRIAWCEMTFARNQVRNIRGTLTQNDCTHEMAAAGKGLAAFINTRNAIDLFVSPYKELKIFKIKFDLNRRILFL